MSEVISTSSIETELRCLSRLRFSTPIEAKFDAEGVVHRKRVGRISLMAGIVIFNAFLFADREVMPDVFELLAVLRLGVFTPVCLVILFLLPRTSTSLQVDTMAVGGTAFGVALPVIAATFSQSPYVAIYQFGGMVTMTYFTLVQRVRFRMAVLGLVVIVAIQLGFVALTNLDIPSYRFVMNFYIAGAVLLLMGSYIQERTERQSFLERLRSDLLVERVEWTARTDMLTGLSNRHHLGQISGTLQTSVGRQSIAALMIDIDHFKLLNDALGHQAGDRCIRDVARIILDALTEEDPGGDCHRYAFRFGGEEFLVLLAGWSEAQATALGNAIRLGLAKARMPHPGKGAKANVTVSIGMAVSQGNDFDLDTLIGAADAALYQAKNAGRDRMAIAA